MNHRHKMTKLSPETDDVKELTYKHVIEMEFTKSEIEDNPEIQNVVTALWGLSELLKEDMNG